MKRVTTRQELLELKAELGVSMDWHEPDEQEVDARVYGQSFDNAGFWGPNVDPYLSYAEMAVVLYKEGRGVAIVNLATLFAWATGYEAEVEVEAPKPESVPPIELPDGYRVLRDRDSVVMTRVMSFGDAGSLCRDMNRKAKARGESAATYRVEPFWSPKSDEAFDVVETLTVAVKR